MNTGTAATTTPNRPADGASTAAAGDSDSAPRRNRKAGPGIIDILTVLPEAVGVRTGKKLNLPSADSAEAEPIELANSQFDFNSLSKTQRLLAAFVGVIVSSLLVFIYWRVTQILLRYKALRQNLKKLPVDELTKAVAGEENAAAVRSSVNDVWINTLLLGITATYGLGAMVVWLGSLATFGSAVFDESDQNE